MTLSPMRAFSEKSYMVVLSLALEVSHSVRITFRSALIIGPRTASAVSITLSAAIVYFIIVIPSKTHVLKKT